jgi:hypothetical protein
VLLATAHWLARRLGPWVVTDDAEGVGTHGIHRRGVRIPELAPGAVQHAWLLGSAPHCA